MKGLRQVRRVLEGKPLVAIGGITAQNARDVLKSGADHVAIIHDLLADPDGITDATRHLTALLDNQVI
jgi:thiamine monophosphate synthase